MLMLFIGIWLFFCMYHGAKQKAIRQQIRLVDGKLFIRNVLAYGWTGSMSGNIEIDIRDFLFESIISYRETTRYFIIDGTSRFTKTDNYRETTTESTKAVKVARCFEDEKDFKEYLDKAIKMGVL